MKLTKHMFLLNVIAESGASNMVLTLNIHQQSPTYVGSIIRGCINLMFAFII